MSEFEYLQSIERTNQADRDDMERIASELRQRMISSAFSAVKNYWKLQEENFDNIAILDNPENESFDYYVLPTFTGFPFVDGEPILSLSLLLKPEIESAEDEDVAEDMSQMSLFIPLPSEVIADDTLQIEEIPVPTKIAVEFISPNGINTNFVVDITGVSPFVNAIDSGDQAEPDMFEEDELNKLIDGKLRIREDVEIIPKLFKHMVEWSAIVQSTIKNSSTNNSQ